MKFLSNIPENDVYLVSKLANTLGLPIKTEIPGRNAYGIPVKESASISVPDTMEPDDYMEFWHKYTRAKNRHRYWEQSQARFHAQKEAEANGEAPEPAPLRKPRAFNNRVNTARKPETRKPQAG